MAGSLAEGHDPTIERAAAVRVLLVEDTPEYRVLAESALRDEGFDVVCALDGQQAVESARALEHDVVVLDLVLPRLDGLEACRQIREFSNAYIIMLTVKGEEVDKLVGLSVGADDYLTKPYSPRELVARIHAMLRRPRSSSSESEQRHFGELVIDPVAVEVSVAGRPVELTHTEFEILDLLSANPRVVFSRERLMERVWGLNWHGDLHVIDVHIGHLRRKLGDDPRSPHYIRTVRGTGFRMGTGD